MIAVIGMAARFPGAPDLDAYWELLQNGREGLVRLDADSLLVAGVAPETLADARYVPVAAMLDGFDRFDAAFWGIGAHEAALMDPQQRILLELAWHALEDAAIDSRRSEASIGVFVGTAISTYLLFQLRHMIAGPSAPSQLLAMAGNDKDYMATQLAYRLDLKGPAVSVQTACSSSLVAVHMACQSLLSGECDIALAGGVSVRVPQRVGYLYEAGGMLSPDGHCRSFAEDAAGTVFGSGAGLVVLRRAEEAGKDRIRAVIVGSAVNNDGSRKIGFTAPSQDRQAAVIAEAMAVAGLAPTSMGYVEGHGTATPLGDPVEVTALAAAYRGAARGSVALGSCKSNIGHTETAAGVAGLIKTILMLERATVVPTLHAQPPSTRINWAETPFSLPGETRPWTERRLAGVSSFGIGGTNAHVIVGAAPSTAATPLRASRLILSARTEAALVALRAAYMDRLTEGSHAFAEMAGATTRRARLPVWLIADTPRGLMEAAPQFGPVPEMAADGDGPPLDVPLYPFQRARYWIAADGGLLGPAVATPFNETLRQVQIDPGRLALLRQHCVEGVALLPAAVHLAAFAEIGPVSDVTIERPLPLEHRPSLQIWQGSGGQLRTVAGVGGEWPCLARAHLVTAAPKRRPFDVGNGEALDADAWAATMAAAGLVFGPDFRLITRLYRGASGVRAELDMSRATSITVIDAGLQALGAAVAAADNGFRPSAVGRFVVTGDLMTTAEVIARLTGDDADQIKRGDVVWLDAGGAVLAEALDVLCRRARAADGADMVYQLAWRPDPDPSILAPYPALERVACVYARRALDAVSQPARASLAALLRRHAARADATLQDPRAVCRALVERYPEHRAEIGLVERCGTALADVLAGARDPLDILFGSGDGTAGAYQASPLASHVNRIVGAVAAGGRPARVLEIGGGTAATTAALHGALQSGAADYLFTDVSPAFLNAAARRFADWPAFRTAPLDITRDPAGQGIGGGCWDLVVAANVLHVAPDLAAALRNASRLLAPGGRLLLVEGIGPLARLDITFGLTDEWTRQDDRMLRPEHPLVDPATWQRLVSDAGLQDVTVVAELGGQVVLTAVIGPPRWVAVGRDRMRADALGLKLLTAEDRLPDGRLDGVVALAGLESGDGLADLLTLSRALIERSDAPRLLILTSEPESPGQAALGGFIRTLAREHPALRPRSVGVDGTDFATAVAIERAIDDGEDRAAWRDGRRMLARLEKLTATAPERTARRLAHDLTLAPMERPEPGPGEVLVRVHAAGINYKDALTAAGQVPPVGSGLGAECAGEVEAVGPGVTAFARGDDVVAVGPGALATFLCTDAQLVVPKPAALDFARAAAVPIAGVTAWYALRHLARIRRGHRVFVHAGSGGVGWFAIRIAQAAGAEVVATAGSELKRARLSALGVGEVYASRDTGFAAARPVDVVLGALPPPQREAALRLLRPGGCYIEIGRVGVTASAARPDITQHLVALDRVDAATFGTLLREVLDAVAHDLSLIPPVTTLPLGRAGEAFATMMRAAHIGKLVALPGSAPTISAGGSYLVTGGLGGLGPEIAAWLRRRGAGGVVRLARRAQPDGRVDDDVVIGDVTDPAALHAVDAHLRMHRLPRLRGVVHAAGVLEDGVVTSLDRSSFARVAAPKLDGLHAIRSRWPDLELLVGFSSAGALFGSAGQATHTAASAAFDAALAEIVAAGRHAVAVDWGAWRERGAAVATALVPGMEGIATADGFAALDRILDSGLARAVVLNIDQVAMRKAGVEPILLRNTSVVADVPPAPAPPAAMEAMSPEDRRAWLQERITAESAGMLAIHGSIDPRRPLHELGLDSLAALELRNRLGRLTGCVLPASLLFDYPTVVALTDHLAATYFGLSAAEPGPKPIALLTDDDLGSVSDEQLDDALSAFAAIYGDDA